MKLRDKYQSLLDFFDGKQYDLDEVAEVLDKVITAVKEKGGINQAGCAWVIMMLYKKGKCTTLQIEDMIVEFNEYCNGFDEYIYSIVLGDKDDAQLTYYNAFVHKKIKGE